MAKHRYEPTPLPVEYSDDPLWSLDSLSAEVFGDQDKVFRVTNLGEHALNGMGVSDGTDMYALDAKKQMMRKYYEMPDGTTRSFRMRQPDQVESTLSRSPMKRRMQKFGRKAMNLFRKQR